MISIVIPNYDGLELLRKNLPRILGMLAKSKLEYELIIVDDASPGGEVKGFLEKFAGENERVRVVFKDKNEGFASTAHRGFFESKGEFVFVIKNDAVPESEKYFSLLLKHFDDPKVFAVGAAQKTIENGKEEIRGQGVIYYEKGFFLHKRGLQANQSTSLPVYTSWPDGSASAYRRDLYLKIGGFDPIYNPGYWEDVDLGFRAWKAGYVVEFEPKAVLLHDYERSSLKKKYGAEKIKLISLKHQFDFLWSNADLKYIFKYIFWLPVHYAIAIKNGDLDLIKAHLWSLLGSLQLFAIRLKRKDLHKLSDDEVFQKFSS